MGASTGAGGSQGDGVNAPARSRVAIRAGDRQVDVAIPSGASVYDALRDVGVDLGDGDVAVVDSTGRALDRYAATGADLVDGAVLHVVRRGGRASGVIIFVLPEPFHRGDPAATTQG